MPVSDLRAIETFIKAIELGSIRRAAAAQGVSPQAASQALAGLEQRLGVRLLHRTTRSLALTTEGQQFLDAAQPALAALERAGDRVRNVKDAIAGPLRIVAPKYSFLPVLWPLLDEFCGRHPDVEPDIKLDDRIGSWVEDRTDVGFRIGQPPEDGVSVRRLFAMQLIVCASPAYLARHGAPQNIEQLAAHRCSTFRHPGSERVLPWLLKVDGEVTSVDVRPALSSNDAQLETQAVLSGHVIGLLSGLSAAAPIRAGRLVPLLTQHVTDHMSVHVYYGSRAAQPSRVRAFIDLTIERLLDAPDYVLSPQELAEKSG
ncbi:LysR family transcriptional regulator [Ewingella americana]|uniref:LysR family transcriptional regulator n=2 Tax=Ewingella americana TaxID=41202 RepID=A0A085GHM6_EWIA3|nr:LysR family transcriptional regulator [Ewingella americana]KAA8729414.1 LysR family transcriptional regulator [Ewingella americana]KFC83221.1 LysR family transcriptional regulator [Ewingella americana ATCC 33852]STQ45131.1 D-malate degradation protein R [Ewingella americana]